MDERQPSALGKHTNQRPTPGKRGIVSARQRGRVRLKGRLQHPPPPKFTGRKNYSPASRDSRRRNGGTHCSAERLDNVRFKSTNGRPCEESPFNRSDRQAAILPRARYFRGFLLCRNVGDRYRLLVDRAHDVGGLLRLASDRRGHFGYVTVVVALIETFAIHSPAAAARLGGTRSETWWL
jgi:hypothetical protein